MKARQLSCILDINRRRWLLAGWSQQGTSLLHIRPLSALIWISGDSMPINALWKLRNSSTWRLRRRRWRRRGPLIVWYWSFYFDVSFICSKHLSGFFFFCWFAVVFSSVCMCGGRSSRIEIWGFAFMDSALRGAVSWLIFWSYLFIWSFWFNFFFGGGRGSFYLWIVCVSTDLLQLFWCDYMGGCHPPPRSLVSNRIKRLRPVEPVRFLRSWRAGWGGALSGRHRERLPVAGCALRPPEGSKHTPSLMPRCWPISTGIFSEIFASFKCHYDSFINFFHNYKSQIMIQVEFKGKKISYWHLKTRGPKRTYQLELKMIGDSSGILEDGSEGGEREGVLGLFWGFPARHS